MRAKRRIVAAMGMAAVRGTHLLYAPPGESITRASACERPVSARVCVYHLPCVRLVPVSGVRPVPVSAGRGATSDCQWGPVRPGGARPPYQAISYLRAAGLGLA